jgi:hypothetical protein
VRGHEGWRSLELTLSVVDARCTISSSDASGKVAHIECQNVGNEATQGNESVFACQQHQHSSSHSILLREVRGSAISGGTRSGKADRLTTKGVSSRARRNSAVMGVPNAVLVVSEARS